MLANEIDFEPGIVVQIQRLFLQKEPLNLAAIRRNHPKLLLEIYSQKPFLGWRNALQSAGISYSDIEVELLDTCECLICGHKAAILTSHLTTHSLTPQEYRREFPGAEIMSETLRAAKMRAKPELQHWEPIWSFEYVLDRVWEFHQRGWPISSREVQVREQPLLNYVCHIGRKWDEVIETLGLKPEDIRKAAPSRELSKAEVIESLLKRKETGKSMASSSVQRDSLALMNAARRKFGSYEKALRAAGLKPERLRIRKVSLQRLKREMKRVASLHGPERAKAARKLKAKWTSRVCQKLGNWEKACREFGVKSEDLAVHAYATKAHAIEGLRLWASKGANFRQVYEDDRPLVQAIFKLFGTMKKAQKAAGAKLVDLRRKGAK